LGRDRHGVAIYPSFCRSHGADSLPGVTAAPSPPRAQGPVRLAVAILLAGVLAVWLVKPIGDPCAQLERLPQGSTAKSSPSFSPPLTRTCTYTVVGGVQARSRYVPWLDWIVVILLAGLAGAAASVLSPGARRARQGAPARAARPPATARRERVQRPARTPRAERPPRAARTPRSERPVRERPTRDGGRAETAERDAAARERARRKRAERDRPRPDG